MNAGRKKQKYGFSLVEIALAILVMAVGLLTVFAIFPAGLKQTQEAENDTRASMFAEYVLNSVHAYNNFTNLHEGAQITLSPIAPYMWNTQNSITIDTNGENLSGIVRYANSNIASRTVYEQYVVRYNLRIENVKALDLLRIQLNVFPQEFGTNGLQSFYTEVPYKGQDS